MKILAIGAMHGPPEVTGLRLVESLASDPIGDIDGVIGNELAIQEGVRYSKHNLAVKFPGVRDSPDYELARPAELIDISQEYDAVTDSHDRPEAHGEYALLSTSSNPRLLSIAGLMSIRHCIIVGPDSGCMVSHVPHAITLELARGGGEEQIKGNVRRLRECVGTLASMDSLPAHDSSGIEFYQDIIEIPVGQAHDLKLQQFSVEPFARIPDAAIQRLGLEAGFRYHAEYWGISSSEEYFGCVLQAIEPPFPR